MRALYIFNIATRILTTKHPKLVYTSYRQVERCGESHFQLTRMQKMNIRKTRKQVQN